MRCELILQLNEYMEDPYFFQFLQSNTTVCLITICMFCKSCETEIVITLTKRKQFPVTISYKMRKSRALS